MAMSLNLMYLFICAHVCLCVCLHAYASGRALASPWSVLICLTRIVICGDNHAIIEPVVFIMIPVESQSHSKEHGIH